MFSNIFLIFSSLQDSLARFFMNCYVLKKINWENKPTFKLNFYDFPGIPVNGDENCGMVGFMELYIG